MGHEISHALANHTAERMSRATRAITVVRLLPVRLLALTLPNSRDAEKEADVMGMVLATKAGYDPEKAAVTLAKNG